MFPLFICFSVSKKCKDLYHVRRGAVCVPALSCLRIHFRLLITTVNSTTPSVLTNVSIQKAFLTKGDINYLKITEFSIASVLPFY